MTYKDAWRQIFLKLIQIRNDRTYGPTARQLAEDLAAYMQSLDRQLRQ